MTSLNTQDRVCSEAQNPVTPGESSEVVTGSMPDEDDDSDYSLEESYDESVAKIHGEPIEPKKESQVS